MRSDELELYSTQELIDELMRRTTFQGIVVHSAEEAKRRAGGRNGSSKSTSTATWTPNKPGGCSAWWVSI